MLAASYMGSRKQAIALLIHNLPPLRHGERCGSVAARMRLRAHEAMFLHTVRKGFFDDASGLIACAGLVRRGSDAIAVVFNGIERRRIGAAFVAGKSGPNCFKDRKH
jgi:hypothetical protein